MDAKEWDYNEVLSLFAKEMGVELDNDDVETECQSQFVGIGSVDVYSGGRKLPKNPTTKVYCNGPRENISINFDNNY